MRNSGTNKPQYQLDRSALKLSPQMSNSRHQISNLKVENATNQPNSNWKSHQIPITAPVQVSQYLTQQLQNQLKSNQNHLICTCPPEVHKALLEQQLLQHQNHHQHFPAQHIQHFQPCPHQRQAIKAAGMDSQAIYALVNQPQQQQQQPFLQPQFKTTTSSAGFSVDPNSVMSHAPGSNQLTMSYPSLSLQNNSWYSRQSSTPETMAEARAQISKMESQMMYLTSWIQNNLHVNMNNNSTNGNYVYSEPNYVPTAPDSIGIAGQHGASCLPCYIVTNDRIVCPDLRDGHSNNEATPSNSSLDSAYSAKSTTSSENNSSVLKQQFTIPDNSSICLPCRSEDKQLPTDVISKLIDSQSQLQSMRDDITTLRKWNQSLRLTFKDEINEIFLKIKKSISSAPGANHIPIRREREKIDNSVSVYVTDVEFQIDKLEDLEVAIEDLRMNVLNRRCRVNIEEVEVLALHLSKISKSLAINKSDYPVLEMKLRQIMQTELEIMKKDERFMETEPRKVENALRLCKKLISTLFTLKRLGSVQENTGSDGIPEIRSNRDPKPKDRQIILDDIKTILPDHDYRMEQIALSEKLRDCRKRMLTSHESLKFEKSLELAAKTLKDVGIIPTPNVIEEARKDLSNHAKDKILMESRECDSMSSMTDSDIDTSSKPELTIVKKELPTKIVSGFIQRLPLINDLSHTSSSDTSNDQDSSDNAPSSRHRYHSNVVWVSSRFNSKHSTILKTSQHSSRSNRSSKVAFNRTVTVEGGSEVLQLNCPEDDYDEDLSSMTFTSPPPPPPPRLSSQDETVSGPDAAAYDDNSIWHQKYQTTTNQVSKTEP